MIHLSAVKMIVGCGLFYKVIQVVLILSMAGGALIAGHSIRRCAEINEYCQTHDECCSNSCLTYLYRCTKSHRVYPYPFLGVNYNSTVTLDDILAMNFDKNTVGTTEKGPVFLTRFNSDNDISQEDIKFVPIVQESKDDDIQSTTLGTTEPPQTSSTMITINEEGACKEIGLKCYRDSECCTHRCHGFLHKCVT